MYVTYRYTYGKDVDGVAYIRFGIIDQGGNRTYLTGLERQATVCVTESYIFNRNNSVVIHSAELYQSQST